MNAYKAQLGGAFNLLQSADSTVTAAESSPYTDEKLSISYPCNANIDSYINNAKAGMSAWKKASPNTRAGILVESLEKIKDRFFELAYATMHTTGQSFVMSFQASGPHSNDRALEAIALGLYELNRFPDHVEWTKPMGKFDVTLQKYYKKVPMGVGMCIGCSTFPVWNTVPGLYANLVTGNPTIVKPHPMAVYPIAIAVASIQEALKENGFDPNIVQLAVDTPENQITTQLAEHKAIKLIDFTGGNEFGNYIEGLPGKRTFTEKAGINSVILHSAKDMKAMMQNLSFSISLYSGQMCTAPQNFYIPKNGITVDGEQVSYEDTVGALTKFISGLVNHEKMGPGTLGAVQNPATSDRVKHAEALGYKVLLPSGTISNPEFPNARISTPTVVEVPSDKIDVFRTEMFGPIVFVIPTDDINHSISLTKQLSDENGALTVAAYTTDADVQEKIIDEIADTYTSIAFNLVGPIWVNQSAGFSDFHVTGGNPAGNASLTDPEFVLGRFEIVGIRIHE